MARRIIRTIDGQIFSDSLNRFEDRKGYVLYKKGLFKTVRINKRGITSDDTSGLSDAMQFLLLLISLGVMFLIIWSAING